MFLIICYFVGFLLILLDFVGILVFWLSLDDMACLFFLMLLVGSVEGQHELQCVRMKPLLDSCPTNVIPQEAGQIVLVPGTGAVYNKSPRVQVVLCKGPCYLVDLVGGIPLNKF